MKNKKLLALALLTAFGVSNNISAFTISYGNTKIQLGKKSFDQIIKDYGRGKASLQDLVDRLIDNPEKFKKRLKALEDTKLLGSIKEKIAKDFNNEISRVNESLDSIKDNLKNRQTDPTEVEKFTNAVGDLAKTAKEIKGLFTDTEREAFQKKIENVAKDGEKAINDIKGIKTQSVDNRLEVLEEQAKATEESLQKFRRKSFERAQRARRLSKEQINRAAKELDRAFELRGSNVYRGNSLDNDVAKINKLIEAREDISTIRAEIEKFVTKATGLDLKPVDEDLKSYLDDIAKGLDAFYPTLGKGRFRSKLDTMRKFLKEESDYTDDAKSQAGTPRRGKKPGKIGDPANRDGNRQHEEVYE